MDSKICILLPAVRNVPMGGYKVIYEYANRLVDDGNHICFVYASYFPDLDRSVKRKTKCVLKYLYQLFVRKQVGCKWFEFKPNIEERFVWSYSSENLPLADVYIATAVTTAIYVSDQVKRTGAKGCYFIQDYETFICKNQEYIKNTYRLGLRNIAISAWLKDVIVAVSGRDCEVVVNGFNRNQYLLNIPICQKKAFKVSMLYHTRPAKDIPTGLKALEIVKQQVPNLSVEMFGVYTPPKDLPSWIHYTQNPTQEQHLRINNECAIYLGCSKMEGWGLTVGEAMMCGQAVVCTDNKGYLEMAQNNFNALVSPVGDSQSLADNIIKLMTNDKLRCQIAQNGMASIRKFDIENSYLEFKTIITK